MRLPGQSDNEPLRAVAGSYVQRYGRDWMSWIRRKGQVGMLHRLRTGFVEVDGNSAGRVTVDVELDAHRI